MNQKSSEQIYYSITIEANSPDTEIWLGDDDGHFVQKETGCLNSSVMPGNYTVEFGLGTRCYPISLNEDMRLTQVEIEAGPSCQRPLLKSDTDEHDETQQKESNTEEEK